MINATIEKNIPMPVRTKGKLIWDKMEVGDSIFTLKRKNFAARQWAKNKKNECEFIEQKENDGFRIWRTK